MQVMRAGRTTHYLSGLPAGDAGVKATLLTMRELAREFRAHPGIRDLAKKITIRCREKDWLCEARSLHQWVQRQIKYQRDVHGIETVQSPDKTLADGSGDCDDKCVLLAALLLSIGHPVRFVALAFQNGAPFSHVILETRIGAYWLAAECTEHWPLGRRPPNIKRYMIQKI